MLRAEASKPAESSDTLTAVRAVLLLTVGLTGCLQGVAVAPPFEGPFGTLVSITGADGPEPTAVVQAGDEPFAGRAWHDGPVLVLGYVARPEILQLPLGPLSTSGSGPRALPAPDDARRGEIVDGAVAWSAAAPDPAVWARFRLPELDAEACLAAAGCLSSAGADVGCSSTCKDGPPAAPAAPAAACPAGWLSDEVPCRPPPPPEAACGLGLRFDRDRAACAPIAACPAGDFFVPEGVGGAVYVRAGATGGDGSPERPFGRLDEAWSLAGGRALLLGPGEYELGAGDPTFAEGRRVVGACPERSVIRVTGTWGVGLGALDLSRVRLVAQRPGETVLWCAVDARIEAVEIVHQEGVGIAVVGSTVAVSRSVIRTTGSRETIGLTANAGRLTVEHTTLDGWNAISMYDGSRVALSDSLVFGRVGRTSHVLQCVLCGDLEVTRTTIRFSAGNGINVVGPAEVRVEDVAIYAPTGDGVKVSACQTEFHCNDTGCPPNCGPMPVPFTHLDVRRLYVEDAQDGSGLVADGIRMDVDDAVFVRMGTRAVDASSPPQHHTVVSIDRVWAGGALGGALRLSGQNGPMTATVRDLTAVGTDRIRIDRAAVVSLENADATLERVSVADAEWHGVFGICGTTTLRDVSVVGAGGSGVALVPNQPGRFERIAVERAQEVGILVDGALRLTNVQACLEQRPVADGMVDAADLSVVAGEGQEGGIRVSGGSALEVERFRVRGGEEGLRIQGISEGRFVAGVVSDAEVGLALPAEYPLTRAVQSVAITGATTPVLRQ